MKSSQFWTALDKVWLIHKKTYYITRLEKGKNLIESLCIERTAAHEKLCVLCLDPLGQKKFMS